ncbi:MAG: flagellar FlbD family protein [Sporolactobacillus sp.]
MIELTHFNGQPFLLNPFLIEQIEALPDTTVTLTTGKKLVVKESLEQVRSRVLCFLRDISLENAARGEESVMRCSKAED